MKSKSTYTKSIVTKKGFSRVSLDYGTESGFFNHFKLSALSASEGAA